MNITVKSLQFKSIREALIIKEQKRLIPKKDHVIIKTLHSLISNGTELLVYQGKIPKSCYKPMSTPLMHGSFDFPIIYGYSLVGKVIDADKKIKNKYVHVLNPHQSYTQVTANHCFFLPDNLPTQRGTLISNMETVINAIWDSKVSLGDKVLVMGYGLIGGLLAMTINKFTGADVCIFETSNHKKKIIKEHGLKLDNDPKNYDICFHATSSTESLDRAIESIGQEGTVIDLNWYANSKVSLSLGQSFHYQRKKLIASQVSSIPSFKRSRWDFYKRKQLAAQLLMDSHYERYLTKYIPLEKSPDFFKTLDQKQYNGFGCCINY